jgi:hypothetical protein|tara:strand:+ start:651 stop:833 length:183 start_codon:yes stop_codon:yes gene_type:complete
MAAYAVIDYSTGIGNLAEVTALMETHLETLDSTNNTIYYIDILPTGAGAYKGVILYADAG